MRIDLDHPKMHTAFGVFFVGLLGFIGLALYACTL